jgi:tripartite ATP-independent transporter DctP family solute receptor
MKAFAKFTLGLISVIAIAAPASAQQEIIFGISAKPGSLQQLTAAEFTRRANERLAGKATVKLFDSQQLGKDKEMMQKLKLGSVHITLPSSIMSSIAGEFGVFDMPFLIKNRDQVKKIEQQMLPTDLGPAAANQGYEVLAMWENGVRHITNNTRPITTPADLKGLKIRTPKSTWRVKMFESWGANPTPMSFGEVFVALQTGVIDGQENPYTNIWNAKLNEVQKYLSVTGHVYSPAYPTVGTDVFSKLDPEIQQALRETAVEMGDWARAKGAEDDGTLRDKLEAAGMEVNVADRQAFVDASAPIYEQFSAEVENGGALIDKALSLAN